MQFSLVLSDVDLFTKETANVVSLISQKVRQETERTSALSKIVTAPGAVANLRQRGASLRELQAVLLRVKVMRERYLWLRWQKPV